MQVDHETLVAQAQAAAAARAEAEAEAAAAAAAAGARGPDARPGVCQARRHGSTPASLLLCTALTCCCPLCAAPEPAAAPAAAAELPEGWASTVDPQGRTYYWHKRTQKTQWERPTAETPVE